MGNRCYTIFAHNWRRTILGRERSTAPKEDIKRKLVVAEGHELQSKSEITFEKDIQRERCEEDNGETNSKRQLAL